MRNNRLGGLVAIAAITVVTALAAPVGAAGGSLTIDSVGGQAVKKNKVSAPLSGVVETKGTASVDGGSTAGPAALVADAGDSPFVVAGSSAALLGTAHGGTAPHTFAWSTAAGAITEGADGATALVDTTGLADGSYTATLVVTDATGASATDTVTFVVTTATSRVLLDETKNDPGPGVLNNGVPSGTVDFPFDVAGGTQSIDVVATWGLPTNDYDLTLVDPKGAERLINGAAPGVTSEDLHLNSPEPGTWIARLEKFATVTDTIHVVVTAAVLGADPRPSVTSGGPYRFPLDAGQTLAGTVTGGTGAVTAAWDLDDDGTFETSGAQITSALAPGRHLVTFKATDSAGHERREMTSVLVADPARLAAETTAISVIGVADSGINPYHLEFSAATYPDPDVLALTENFTRHPSEYIPGYPADATALPITVGQGYYPEQDAPIWAPGNIEANRMYWFPGTKIIGAIDSAVSTGANAGADPTSILDDNGHGTGSASVSTGNRYGYCPTCLLVVVEGLEEGILTQYSWIDIGSHSFGYQFGLPVGPAVGPNEPTRQATERGQTILFAAGNGVGNAFDVPIATYGSDQTGPDWNITVGAIRRDNQRGIVGDGIPVHLSSWGDGNLPSACRTGTVGQCAFGGTSAATPYTAGVFGTVLTQVRDAIGDAAIGQRTVGAQGQVVASGAPVPESVYLADGVLTRAELREVVFTTAESLTGETSTFPFPATAPYNTQTNVLFEGYGAATPNSAQRAVDVLLGRDVVPDRSYEDSFFAIDSQVRDTIYGGYDRNGDGTVDFEGFAGGLAALGLTEATLDSLGSVDGMLAVLGKAAELSAPASTDTAAAAAGAAAAGGEPSTWYLHRRWTGGNGTTGGCAATSNELHLDQADTPGDIEPCYESRITSIPAAYRPLGIWASSETLTAPLPAGTDVTVDLYVAVEVPTMLRPTGVLMATDREIGEGAAGFAPAVGTGPGPGSSIGAVVATVPLPDGGGCVAAGELCWTHFHWTFETSRPAFVGEQITFQIQLVGARAWSFGYEGAHASRITITPAPLPETGFEFGVTITSPDDGEVLDGGDAVVVGGTAAFPDQGTDPTGAGDHPGDRRVEVSLDDPAFATPLEASYDSTTGSWSAPLGDVSDGDHVVYARARVGEVVSEADSVAFTVRPANRVEWQVVDKNSTPHPAAWQDASGLANWSFSFDTATYGSGAKTIVTRLVSDGLVLNQQSVSAKFK